MNRGGTRIGNWRFEEVGAMAGVQKPLASFATWFWDYDNDGWQDLMVMSYDIGKGQALHDAVAYEYWRAGGKSVVKHPPTAESARLYRNNQDGTFTDVTARAGLADKVIFSMGTNFGDLDNDGWLDMYIGTGNPDLRSIIPNRMFRNVRGTRFEEVTLEGGFGHIQKGHGAAFADLDRDGDEDVYMVMGGAYEGDTFANVLFENPGWPTRRWLALELQGTTANRSALGARVAVTTRNRTGVPRTIYRTVTTGGSFGAGPLQLHVGLDDAVAVTDVRIVWPDRASSTQSLGPLALNSTWRVTQGAPAQRLSRPPVPFRKSVMTMDMRH